MSKKYHIVMNVGTEIIVDRLPNGWEEGGPFITVDGYVVGTRDERFRCIVNRNQISYIAVEECE